MGTATTRFFDRLANEAEPSFLERGSGTLRFDLRAESGTDHWLVALSKQSIEVKRGEGDADCVMTCDQGIFDELVDGKVNMMAALLRGLIDVQGRAIMLVIFQRLFAPPHEQDEAARLAAGYARRKS